ncbi:alpha/beta fold hydrolase [Streptomyces sp. NPDC093071]|uniref:alpha/beta fold hydrolase n=1 Tax=Streptomyces sp. NPDC093071 TaxID=3366022 RepID=UPI00380058FF
MGDGSRVHWEVSGNPEGKPALVVHGGPGSGSSPRSRRLFDPEAYRVVLFDQRGCGRSVPHASDPAADLSVNTTAHLVADMERLREHLGIDAWLLYGGFWGSTLILAYAEAHPERFRAGAGAGPETGAEGLVGAYAALMNHPERAVREKAAADWCAWEDAVLSAEGMGTPYTDRVDDARLGFVRICSHYFAHGAWLEEGALIRDAHRLAGIPGVLVHGRLDMGGPLATAWEPARAWPDAELRVVERAGHLGGEETGRLVLAALDRLART